MNTMVKLIDRKTFISYVMSRSSFQNNTITGQYNYMKNNRNNSIPNNNYFMKNNTNNMSAFREIYPKNSKNMSVFKPVRKDFYCIQYYC